MKPAQVPAHVFHVNDYPAVPPRETIGDHHRVYPGDDVTPLGRIFRDLRAAGFGGFLSLELFNRDCWKTDPATVARTGIEKMCAPPSATPSRDRAVSGTTFPPSRV